MDTNLLKNKIKTLVIDTYSQVNADSTDNLHLSLTLGRNEESRTTKGILPLLKISERLKKTFRNEIELREGLKLMINDYKLKKGVIVDFNILNSPLEFVFCLSGKISVLVNTNQDKTENININKAMNLIFSFPASSGKIVITPEEPVKIISLHISPDFLRDFIDKDLKMIPAEISNFINGDENNSFIYNSTISPDMYVAINQIFDCRFKGLVRKMYLESKALELMTLQLAELYKMFNSEQKKLKLSDSDLVQINKVKSYLTENLNKSVTLKELSELACMSHTKLNFCFKTEYGVTVFEFLRNHRLEYSRFLLTQGHLNITEIVYEAGWSNPSHFSKEFLKHYGVNPKTYQKSIIK